MTARAMTRNRRRACVPRLLAVLCAALLPLLLLPASVQAQEVGGGVTPARVAGADRFETAARIADRTFDAAEVAVLATGLDFPDALAGAFAAGHLAGPILLVERDRVPPATLGMLSELGVSRVVLLGGPAAIGAQVEQVLAERGYPSERIAGEDRYETAARIALELGQDEGGVGGPGGVRTAVLANGQGFADALSAGPLSASAKLPLLLTPPDRTLPVVDFALSALAIERILVVGGEAAVSSDVVAAYQGQGYAVERLAGATREQTALAVADYTIDNLPGFSDRFLLLARGDAFPDALAGGLHGAVIGAPLLLTAAPDRLGGAVDAWLADRCPAVEVVRALGGRSAMTASTLQAAVDAAERCVPPVQEVARFQTPLLGVPDRTRNLHLSADYIDGDVIAAGETYSLNQGIGRRTTARGFRVVEDGCIGAGGDPVDCLGGGISQMGTTFMNAAWFTGVDLVDFRQHSLYFQRYPVCHEATLSWGSLDVQVRNNSPYDIIVDTFYTDEFIGVRFISRPWAEVDSFAQPQDPPSSGPFDSSCGRTITYPDGTSDTETYTWRYEGVGF